MITNSSALPRTHQPDQLGNAMLTTMWTTAAMVGAKAAAVASHSDVADAVAVTLTALQLFAAGLLAVWTYRVCRNVLAAACCFVPFVQAVVPFTFVRRAMRPLLRRTTPITRWQVSLVAAFAVSRLGGHSTLTVRVLCLGSGAMLMAVAALYAHRAIRLVDRTLATAGTTPRL